MKFKAAIFDMDGTLIDSLIVWDVVWSKFGEKYLGKKDFRPTKEDDKKVRTSTLSNAMNLIHANYKMGRSGEELLDFTNHIIKEFYANEVKPKDGVKEFLQYCKNNGCKMCIATATAPDLAKIAIDRCELSDYFLGFFSCATIGKGKEYPDIFLQAQELLGEESKETWVFDDSLVAIETATKIGMPTVGIYDAYNYGQDKMKEIATLYVDRGENVSKLI